MSKKQLEEMHSKVTGLLDSDGDFTDEVKMSVDVYEWFYRQTERVQEFETRDGGRDLAHKLVVHYAKETEQQNNRYREAYNYLMESIKGQSYVCHYKCQDVIGVTDLKEGLFAFELMESDADE